MCKSTCQLTVSLQSRANSEYNKEKWIIIKDQKTWKISRVVCTKWITTHNLNNSIRETMFVWLFVMCYGYVVLRCVALRKNLNSIKSEWFLWNSQHIHIRTAGTSDVNVRWSNISIEPNYKIGKICNLSTKIMKTKNKSKIYGKMICLT